MISPPEVEGRTGTECLALLRGRPRVTLDDRFGHDLMEILKTEVTEDRSPWDS